MEEKQRKTGERSSFAVTCSLLSQYLKENRGFGGQLGVERLHGPPEMEKGSIFRPPTTMNLFPGSDISHENQNAPESDDSASEQSATMPPADHSAHDILKDAKADDQKEHKVNAQLTILYGGKVVVFDNFPAKKVRDLMVMAKGNSFLPPNSDSRPTLPKPASSVLPMPIARRASLHRFLEKRKDRIKSSAPYLVHGSTEPESASSLPKKNQAWLALGHETSFSLD